MILPSTTDFTGVFMRSCIIILLTCVLFSAGFAQTKTTTATPKPASTPKKVIDETAEWDKALAVTDANERIGAISEFLKVFPKTKKLDLALETLVTLRADIGNERLLAGDLVTASDFFKAAAAEAPKPIPEKLFTDILAKFPSNLFFRGAQLEAVEIAKILEERSSANAAQLLSIANFYLSVEMGADAVRLAEASIKLTPDSSAAFQTLGLANRIDFQLEQSAVAYAKAVELDPESITARRGLAEMYRALGRADEAAELYRQIIAKDAENQPAQTGLILALFDSGKRAEAEAAMKASLAANPGNVILLAGAAYWYAAHNEGEKAVEFGEKAIAAEPRFIWSHLATARGEMLLKRPLTAERILLKARQYGNFPTLEYEIASARFAAGFFREAAETLDKNFALKNDGVSTSLGGRVSREAVSFTELVAFERRASIFAPTAADDAENAGRLRALLEFSNAVKTADAAAVATAADKFVGAGGVDDKMKAHRQLFAASQLLEKRLAPQKVLDHAKAAIASVDAGLDAPDAASAVMADELYRTRTIAATRDEYIQLPFIPRATLSAILRGRIEEISGGALMMLENGPEAVIRLKRAVSVLPVGSAWWRSSNWRLGTALASTEKNAEALDAYSRSYNGGSPDPIKYAVIETLYKRVNGSKDGLELRIGRNPLVVAPEVTVAAVQPTPEPRSDPSIDPGPPQEAKNPEITPSPTPAEVPVAGAAVSEPTLTTSPSPSETPTPSPTPEPTPKVPVVSNENRPPLFEPVIISIPSSKPKPKSVATTSEIAPCTVTTSEDVISIKNNGADLAVIVGTENDGDLSSLTATSSSAADLELRRENITAIKGRALYVVRSITAKTGDFSVLFELPCGKKEIVVKVL